MVTKLYLVFVAICLTAVATLAVAGVRADEATINVHADQVVGHISRYLTGACIEDVNHEIYGGIYSQMIYGESFQEPPVSPSISGFHTYGGWWAVHDGELSIAAVDGPKLVSNHASFKTGAAGVELFFADRKGENAGLIVRVNGPGVGADRFSGYEVALDAARQTLRLGRHRNNFELLKDVKCDVAVGRWIPLEVRLAGSAIEILVDGNSMLRYDDGPNALPAGAIGLRAWNREARFRNLWVKTGPESEPLPFAQAEDDAQVSGMWRMVRRGDVQGRFGITSVQPFVGAQSQQLTFESGSGAWGFENQGLNRWGMSFVAGKPYEGYICARAEKPVTLFASLESRDGSRTYSEIPLVVKSGSWRRLDFKLTPNMSDRAGRFALKLKHPGSVTLGYAFLQPGQWGRYKGLPVRKDVVQGMIDQGITVLRYGGSMVNNAGYRWKTMLGPREQRPPYAGTWYRYSSNGWGIPDFMDLCEAAGFAYVPDFCMDETPADMADFIEYARGNTDSRWGSKRAAAGHAAPYRLKYIELGNEERVDQRYFTRFKPMAEAIWAKDPDIILVVGDFFYSRPISDPFHFEGGAVDTLAAHKQILDLARQHGREVWFDVHVGTEAPPDPGDLSGPRSLIDQLGKLSPGARYKVVIFELNAGNHAVKRGLSNALAIAMAERDGRFPIVTSANGLQPDGQNDNGWNQGLLFLNPSQVWLQPPGYVTQMISRNYLPMRIASEVTGQPNVLSVVATRSNAGKTVVLQVVNPGSEPVTARIRLQGGSSRQPGAQVTELTGPLDAVNTANRPDAVMPQRSVWKPEPGADSPSFTFAPHSFTVMRFN